MNFKLNELQWIESRCNWCGSDKAEIIFSGPDRMHHLPGLFTFVRCLHCGIYRQNPRLKWKSLKHYYPDSYNCYTPSIFEISNPLLRLEKRYGPWKRLRTIERYQSGGHLLDVGCGTGQLLEEAQRTGRWTVMGIEPNAQAAEYASKRLNVPVIQNSFSNINLPSDSYDVVVFWNVLEHTYYPIDDLRRAYKILKKGGWIVIGIPNIECWERRLFSATWVGWELPRHLYLFPRDNMFEILSEVGFERIMVRSISSSHATLGLTLDFWSQTWQVKYPTLRNLLLRSYNSIFGRLISLFPLWISDKLNKSSLITFIAQKTW